MPRSTKEVALLTRAKLLDSAELLFHAHGVCATSLNAIALQAGTSRGAIYWHFKDKADLFNAMMERVVLPLEEAFRDLHRQPPPLALKHIRAVLSETLALIATDPHARRVFEIATQKVEYVDELMAVRSRRLAIKNEFIRHLHQGLESATVSEKLTLTVPVRDAAQGLHALVDGVIQNWLLDPQAYELQSMGLGVVDTYLRGLGFDFSSTAI